MALFWLSLAVALETEHAAADGARLATAALASPRPRECRGVSGSEGLWTRARAGDAQRYCDLLARGYARLAQTPAEALLAAEAAEALAGPTPQVRILNARAKLRLGQSSAALEQFQKAEAADAQAFLDPKALHEYARATSLAGKSSDAVQLYRVLVSRSALLADVRERSVVQIEAAAHVLAYAPGGTDEALGYLAQARRESLGLSPWVSGLRLLANERNGRAARALGADPAPSLASLTQPVSAAADESPQLPPGELDALCAVLTEQTDPRESRRHFELFLAHAQSENVWLALARKLRVEPAAGKGKAH
jgi:hypothetical protein